MELLERIADLLCLTAIAGYLAAGGLWTAGRRRLAFWLAVAGWTANLGIFIKNWWLNGYPPFASMYQVLSVLSLAFPLLLCALAVRDRTQRWLVPWFLFAAAIPLTGTLFMDRQMRWSLMPALRSVWFVPHVFSYMLGYALCTVAFLLSLSALPGGSHALDRRRRARCSVCLILRMAFPFLTFGLLLGAVWADQVWGDYWNWDLKEVWALITVLLYLGYFHLRRTGDHPRAETILTSLGFCSLLVTFFCVNLLPKLPGTFHAYT